MSYAKNRMFAAPLNKYDFKPPNQRKEMNIQIINIKISNLDLLHMSLSKMLIFILLC